MKSSTNRKLVDLAGYLFTPLAIFIFRPDVEVSTETRLPAYRRWPCRERKNRFQQRPSGLRHCFELIEQERLAYAWIGYRCDDLAASGVGAFCRVLERLHLGVAANEFRVASSGRALQLPRGPHRAGTRRSSRD